MNKKDQPNPWAERNKAEQNKGEKHPADLKHPNSKEAQPQKEEKKEEKIAGEITHPPYEELEAKLNEAEAKANECQDKWARTQAELENARRRFERDLANAHKYGTEKLIAEMLPVLDGVEKGLTIVPQHDEAKKIHEGLELTQNLILKALEKFGVKQVNPLGEVFNPTWHQALTTKEDPKAKPNTIVEVLQKGYILNDRLLRPALVVIAK